jgi:hypothetical protein
LAYFLQFGQFCGVNSCFSFFFLSTSYDNPKEGDGWHDSPNHHSLRSHEGEKLNEGIFFIMVLLLLSLNLRGDVVSWMDARGHLFNGFGVAELAGEMMRREGDFRAVVAPVLAG